MITFIIGGPGWEAHGGGPLGHVTAHMDGHPPARGHINALVLSDGGRRSFIICSSARVETRYELSEMRSEKAASLLSDGGRRSFIIKCTVRARAHR